MKVQFSENGINKEWMQYDKYDKVVIFYIINVYINYYYTDETSLFEEFIQCDPDNKFSYSLTIKTNCSANLVASTNVFVSA